MGKGYPDFFGYSIFPQFGAFQLTESGAVVVAADSYGTIFDISAKGVVYSGYVATQTLGLADTSSIFARLTVDGQEMYSRVLDDQLAYGFTAEIDIPFVLVDYNRATNLYVFVIQQDITFSQSFKLEMYTDITAQIFCHGYLSWAKVIA